MQRFARVTVMMMPTCLRCREFGLVLKGIMNGLLEDAGIRERLYCRRVDSIMVLLGNSLFICSRRGGVLKRPQSLLNGV